MAMGCRGEVLEVVPCFSSQPHTLDGLLALVLTTGPTLMYGSKKMLVHGIVHTLVSHVGSQAKLDEGSKHKVSACDGVHLAPKLSIA